MALVKIVKMYMYVACVSTQQETIAEEAIDAQQLTGRRDSSKLDENV